MIIKKEVGHYTYEMSFFLFVNILCKFYCTLCSNRFSCGQLYIRLHMFWHEHFLLTYDFSNSLSLEFDFLMHHNTELSFSRGFFF